MLFPEARPPEESYPFAAACIRYGCGIVFSVLAVLFISTKGDFGRVLSTIFLFGSLSCSGFALLFPLSRFVLSMRTCEVTRYALAPMLLYGYGFLLFMGAAWLYGKLLLGR